MTSGDRRPHEVPEWQPTYPVWASGVLASTFLALLVAPQATSLLAGTPWASPLGAAIELGRGHSQGLTAMAVAVVFGTTVLLSVLPGLLSLFLITLTDLRLRLHAPIGAIFFGGTAALMVQTVPAAIFAFVFGLVGLGGTAAALALHRNLVSRSGRRRDDRDHS